MDAPKIEARVLGRKTPLVPKTKGKAVADHPAVGVQADLIALVLETARDVRVIEASRIPTNVLLHLLSEYGELSEEVAIATGSSYKSQGADGVVGEAIDVVLCAVDLLYVLSATLQYPLPITRFGKVAPARPHHLDRKEPLVSMVMGMLHPISLVDFLLGQPTRTKAQRDSVVTGAEMALTQLVSDCLRLATAAEPATTANDLLAVATRKCAKWRAAYTPKTGADHGA